MSLLTNTELLFDCTLCSEMLGIVTRLPVQRYVIYAQDIPGLVGFRSKQSIIKLQGTTYIEVGTFLELLYEGNLDCWLILSCPSEFIDYDNFMGFNENYKNMVNLDLIRGIVNKSKESLKKVSEKVADYGNLLYLCGMEAMIAESLLYSKEFKIQNQPLLQSMVDCKLREDTAKLELDKIYGRIDKHLEISTFDISPDKEYYHTELLKLRNLTK